MPEDKPKLRVLDLFSGILVGGFSLGLERAGGFSTVAFCEIEPFPRKVLAKHWPGVPQYEDVRTLTADTLARDGIAVDVITGGFPCQDLSVAGKRAGLAGERSGLWSEIVRLVGELSPRYVIVENVANLLSGPSERRGGWFGRVLGDLAECGYDAEWENIPAAALGAPHRRERVWIVAYADKERPRFGTASRRSSGAIHDGDRDHQGAVGGRQVFEHGIGGRCPVAHPNGFHAQGQQPGGVDTQERAGPLTGPTGPLLAELGAVWRTEPDVGRVAHGVPSRVDRLAGLGNAVVPQIPELIGRAIMRAEGMA